MPKCKSCGAPINWVKMFNGANMPVEVDKKTIVVVEAGKGYLYKGSESHFANCPNADQHRKPKIQNQKIGPLQNREGG